MCIAAVGPRGGCCVGGCLAWGMLGALLFLARAGAADALPFRMHAVNSESEFPAATALDVNQDGLLDIVCGGWWYAAPTWEKHKLREVERIGGRFDDYSNQLMDVDGDGFLDLVSVNYRSRSLYWVRNPGPNGGDWSKLEIDRPGPSETGRLVDIDGDGVLDILPNGTTYAAWYRRGALAEGGVAAGDVRWTKHVLPEELAGHGIGAGDINGDGRLDLVGSRGWAEAPRDPLNDIWKWHPEFSLARDCSVPILCLDVDQDGLLDLVWGRGHDVGLYWTQQCAEPESPPRGGDADSPVSAADLATLQGRVKWKTQAIDTSWSCAHAPLVGDLDGDGRLEVIAGKRFQGHDGRDPGENDPLVIYSYQYDPAARAWLRRTISVLPGCGLDLDPLCVDLDGDGDLDILAPSRAGLCWLENLRIERTPAEAAEAVAKVGILVAGAQWGDPERPAQEPPLAEYPEHADLGYVLRPDPRVAGAFQRLPLETALDLGQRRRDIQRHMERVMGPLPEPLQRIPLDIEVESIESTEKYARIKLTYAAEPGSRVPAYLVIPHGLTGPAPAVLCLHPTHFELGKAQLLGLGGNPSRFYAHELGERGFVCLAPDYPGFADYKYDFQTQGSHYASGTMKAIWDNIRALDLLESLPCVKRDAIGCIGHSLGGHNTLYTAVFDLRIRAAVSSCGFNAFEDYYGGNLRGWTSDRYMPRIATEFGSDPQRMPFDFPEVLAAIAPRPIFVNAPEGDGNFAVVGVRKCEASVRPLYERFGKREQLRFVYPDAGHDFPDAVREEVYVWLAEQLK
jgi:dienelactone hydrolase